MKIPEETHPIIEARTKLDKLLVQHHRFRDARDQICSNLTFPTDTKIIWVIGPTGVGKTCLSRFIQQEALGYVMERRSNAEEGGMIPSIAFEVPCVSTNHQFAWGQFYQLYLDALSTPIVPSDYRLRDLPAARQRLGPEYPVLNAIQHRRPVVALLDEANHLASVASGKALLSQMVRIKSFVNRANILHVLFGTYEMAPFIHYSGQLARRCEVIHLSRYRAEVESDIKDFAAVVFQMQKCLPVAHHFDLRPHIMYLHERSIGCVGTLKTWFIRALGRALSKGRTGVTLEDLQSQALEPERLRTMLAETLQGERLLAQGSQLDFDTYLEDLGHKQRDTNIERDLFGNVLAPNANLRGRKPFEALPRRNAVGSL